MSQDNVLKILKKKKKWMTAAEICAILKLSNANNSLNKLWNQKEILKKGNKNGNGYQYKYRK